MILENGGQAAQLLLNCPTFTETSPPANCLSQLLLRLFASTCLPCTLCHYQSRCLDEVSSLKTPAFWTLRVTPRSPNTWLWSQPAGIKTFIGCTLCLSGHLLGAPHPNLMRGSEVGGNYSGNICQHLVVSYVQQEVTGDYTKYCPSQLMIAQTGEVPEKIQVEALQINIFWK